MAILCTLPRDLCNAVVETRPILIPVLLCIVLTQLGWVFVYDCAVTKNIFYFGDANSLGGDFWDGMANAASAMAVIALVSSVMITLAIFRFKRIIEAWLACSCVLASAVITGGLFKDGAARFPIGESDQLVIAASLTAVYAGGALLAFFTPLLPAWCQKLYMITNCASMATFYLTTMPGYMAWFLLGAVVVWDIFAVLSPVGPLKLALECAGDYGADTLRFLMFTAENEKMNVEEEVEEEEVGDDQEMEDDLEVVEEVEEMDAEEELEKLFVEGVVQRRPTKRLSAGADKLTTGDADRDEKLDAFLSDLGVKNDLIAFFEDLVKKRETGKVESSEDSEGDDFSSDSTDSGNESEEDSESDDDNNNNGDEKKSAKQALDSGSHLGFGDFIFYSILVGKSMAVGFLPALMTTIGVIVGLAWTLSIDGGEGRETLPALPISIIFGMLGHFSTVAQMAALEFLYSTLFD